MKFKKEKENLIIEIPLKQTPYNPYDEIPREIDNLIGIYEGEHENGLAYRIDMSYKGKNDQWSDYIIKIDDKKKFEKTCNKLKIDKVYL